MKNFLQAVMYFVILGIIYLAVVNFGEILVLKCFANADVANSLHLPNYTKSVRFGVYTLSLFVLGFLSGLVFAGQFYFALQDKFKAYKRELERSSITNSSGEAKINVLEAKIATLEKALNDALNK